MPRWVEKRAIAGSPKEANPAEAKPEGKAPQCSVVEVEQGVYSRGLLLKIMEAHKPARPAISSTDSTESGLSQDEKEEEPEPAPAKEEEKARAVSMDCPDMTDMGLKLRPRAASEGTSSEAAAPAAVAPAPTTVMLRNIPNQYSREKLCQRLDSQGMKGQYDFLYLPIDRNSERNMGYAFINFRTTKACTDFTNTFSGKLASDCLPGYKSNKICEVRVAEVQGQQANLEKMTSPNFFQHLADHEEWQPIFFDEKGERMPLSAREGTEASPGKRSRTTPPAQMMPFIPAGMMPYGYPNMPMPGKCVGPTIPCAAMTMKHLQAQAAARAAALAHAKANEGRPKEMRRQIEYYFSKENISHDIFLRKLMDEEGWVSLKDIVAFPKLRALHADVMTVARALSFSDSIELSQDMLKVRIKSGELRENYPRMERSVSSEEGDEEMIGKPEVATAAEAGGA